MTPETAPETVPAATERMQELMALLESLCHDDLAVLDVQILHLEARLDQLRRIRRLAAVGLGMSARPRQRPSANGLGASRASRTNGGGPPPRKDEPREQTRRRAVRVLAEHGGSMPIDELLVQASLKRSLADKILDFPWFHCEGGVIHITPQARQEVL